MVKNLVAKIEEIGKQENEAEPPEAAEELNLSSWKQIKYLPKFLSKKEKLIIKVAGLAIVISLSMMGYLFLKDNLVIKPKAGGVYTENLVGAPQYINPLYASISEADRDLVRLIFAGLIKFDAQQNITGDLAKEWFINEEGTTYTFQLRDDVYWPDEKQFTSEDVIFTFETIKNEGYQSSIRDNWAGIEVVAVDDFTVQFSLPEPFAPFLENLKVGILPAHLWAEILPENATLAELNLKPVGLGPYQFNSFTKDKQGFIKSYTLKRNENYHLGAPYIEEITFKFQPTFELAVDGLKNRNADGLNFLPQNLKEFLESRNDLTYYSLSLPQYTAIFFNQEMNPELKSNKLRQALNLSIDKEKIVTNVFQDEARAIDGPILPGFPGYIEGRPLEGSDVETAKKLLAELSWSKKKIEAGNEEMSEEATSTEQEARVEADSEGMSKFLFKGDKELRITLSLTNQPQAIAVAELIQKYWQAIGVRVNLNVIEVGQIQKDVIIPRAFEALLFGEILGAEPDLYPFWHSSQADENGLNLANFKNTQADKLLEGIRKEEELEKRAESFIKFEEILMDNMPAIFLYNPNYTYVVSNKVKGIELERIVSPVDRLNGIEKWYIKTRRGFK